MSNKTTTFLAFVLGASAGSFITWRHVKDIYERIAQEEIDSVKKVFLKREAETNPKKDDESSLYPKIAACYENGESKTREKDIAEYTARLEKEGYRQYYSNDSEEKKAKTEKNTPYVISPEEFGEFDEYEKISLTYYSNHILADENDEVIEDVEETVGVESLTHFGEYEDDSVFVRNDVRRCDYEILLDQRSYSEVVSKIPHRMEEK